MVDWQNQRAIILLFVANSISGVAQGISMIAIPWYFASSEDTSLFGYLYAGITAVSLLWGPYCGTLVDRFNRKYIFLALAIVMGLLLSGIATYGYIQGTLPWELVGLAYLATFMNYNLHYPNLYAFMQEITEKQYYSKITSYLEIQGQLSSAFAGAFAAMLLEGVSGGKLNLFGFHIPVGFSVDAWQIHDILMLDAATYFVSFVILLAIRFQPLIERQIEVASIYQRLATGFQFLNQHRPILTFGIASYGIFICVLVTIFYNNPIYVEKHLHASGDVYATSELYYAIGAIFSGIAIRWIFKEERFSIPNSIVIMTLLTAALFFTLQLTSSAAVFYLMLFILGVTNAGTRIQRVTYLFRHIPNHVYGRANSIFFLANVMFRIFFISLFALPYFQIDSQFAQTMGVLGVFLILSAAVLFFYQKNVVDKTSQTEAQ